MANVEVVRDETDKMQFDATKLDGLDPAKHYRWIRKTDMNIKMREAQGYQLTDPTDEKVKHVLSDRTRMKKGADVATTIEWGDMVLAEMKMERYEELVARNRAKVIRSTKAVAATYKAAIARAAEGQDLAYEDHQNKKPMRGVSEAEYQSEMKRDPMLEA